MVHGSGCPKHRRGSGSRTGRVEGHSGPMGLEPDAFFRLRESPDDSRLLEEADHVSALGRDDVDRVHPLIEAAYRPRDHDLGAGDVTRDVRQEAVRPSVGRQGRQTRRKQ